jgi:hypothetical protein
MTLLAFAAAASADEPRGRPEAPLAFRIDEGQNLNVFLRDGPVAAHLLLRSGTKPRILVAFPAGNSGIGLWFADSSKPIRWRLTVPPRAFTTFDDKQRPLRGIEFEVETDAAELRPQAAVLSSIRVLRDFELQGQAPADVKVAARVTSNRARWARDRLDGAAGFQLTIEPRGGARISADRYRARAALPLRLHVQALTGETPLVPLERLLTQNAGGDVRARNALTFLSYRDKFLAGSWRFDTYFGRDTLISALLLAPVLEPDAIESAIASVLARLAPNGEVAHEEDIGEFAVLRNLREGRGRVDTPIYDYGMVDDDFLLAPLVSRWVETVDRARATRFLDEPGPGGERHGVLLARNLAWLVERTGAFAKEPEYRNLVAIKAGRMTGQWRDSEQGLGRGRYAYDVNAALVPAALEATARIAGSGILDAYLDADMKRRLGQSRAQARQWSTRAPTLFDVDVPGERASAAITAFAREIDVDAKPALSALGERALSFHALSLDEQGTPVPILHSDEGFRLLLTEPATTELARCLDAIVRPFPAGLMTDAGLVVANPALASADLKREFTRFAYHGTVVWSWQQALLAAGLDRQLRRADLPQAMRADLEQARKQLWTVIEATHAMRTSELWSWSYANGTFHAEPFGRPGADVDESNAAQLWSTVYLGLTPAATAPATRDTSPGN